MSIEGKFVWYELNANDADEAIDFYTSVIPWGTEVSEMEGDAPPYTMWTAQGESRGGVMNMPEEPRKQGVLPYWLGYVNVSDLEGTLERLEVLGGSRVTEPMNISEQDEFCVVQDPQGAVFCLYHSSAEGMEDWEPLAQNTPGNASWIELVTEDAHAAWDFYSALFGWEKGETLNPEPGFTYQMFEWDGQTWGGMYTMPDEYDSPPHWLFYFTVEDIHSAVERVRDGGGEVFNGPEEVPGGDLVAHCRDPEGAVFALHQTAPGN
jgi:hypothetical protein